MFFQMAENPDRKKELMEWNGKEVEIRGFVYGTSDGRRLLAGQSDLRSCCIGQSHKIEQQILIKGDVDINQDHRMHTLSGRLWVGEYQDQEGFNRYEYVLEHVVVVEAHLPAVALSVFGLSAGISVVLLRRNKSLKSRVVVDKKIICIAFFNAEARSRQRARKN